MFLGFELLSKKNLPRFCLQSFKQAFSIYFNSRIDLVTLKQLAYRLISCDKIDLPPTHETVRLARFLSLFIY